MEPYSFVPPVREAVLEDFPRQEHVLDHNSFAQADLSLAPLAGLPGPLANLAGPLVRDRGGPREYPGDGPSFLSVASLGWQSGIPAVAENTTNGSPGAGELTLSLAALGVHVRKPEFDLPPLPKNFEEYQMNTPPGSGALPDMEASLSLASDCLSGDVAQLVERELAAERSERREEVAFLTKMHEREMDLMKTQTASAVRQLEDERQLFERQSGTLEARLLAVDTRVASEVRRAAELEEDISQSALETDRMRFELEQARQALRSLELDTCAAGQASAQSLAFAHAADRRKDHEEWHMEVATMGDRMARAEQKAHDRSQDEFAAHHSAEMLRQSLQYAEHNLSAAEHLEAEAERRLAGECAEVGRLRGEHQQAELRLEDLEERSAAEGQRARDLLESLASSEATLAEARASSETLKNRTAEQEASMSQSLELVSSASTSEQQELLATGARLSDELSQAEREVELLSSENEAAERRWSSEIREQKERLEEQVACRREVQSEHELAVHDHGEAAMRSRLEVASLRSELDARRRWASGEAAEASRLRDVEGELHADASAKDSAATSREVAAAELQKQSHSKLKGLEEGLSSEEQTLGRLRGELLSAESARLHDRGELEELRVAKVRLEGQMDLTRIEWGGRLRAAEVAAESSAVSTRAIQVDHRDAEAAAKSRVEALQWQSAEALLEARAEAMRLSEATVAEQRRNAALEGQLRGLLDMVDRELFSLRAQSATSTPRPDTARSWASLPEASPRLMPDTARSLASLPEDPGRALAASLYGASLASLPGHSMAASVPGSSQSLSLSYPPR